MPSNPSLYLRLAAACALTCGSLAAQAQSTVTLYGVIDMAYYNRHLAGETRTSKVDSGGMTTSQWGFRGVEDLGGGLKAQFDVAGFIRVDTGQSGRSDADALFGKYAWVGLESRYGSARLGRQSSPGFLNTIRFNPFGDSATLNPVFLHQYLPSATQPMMTGSGSTDSGWNNTVSYLSPRVAGFNLNLYAVPSEKGTTGQREAANLGYTAGPVAASVAFERGHGMSMNFSKPPAVVLVNDFTNVNAGLSYDLQSFKLFGQYVRTKLENPATTITLRTAQLGASVPMGNGRILASWAQTLKDQTAAADQKRRTLSMGYDHDLSKRTDLYAVVINDQLTATRGGTGLALGLRHRF